MRGAKAIIAIAIWLTLIWGDLAIILWTNGDISYFSSFHKLWPYLFIPTAISIFCIILVLNGPHVDRNTTNRD